MVVRGEVLGARYELVEKIGEGGMGSVWLARDGQHDGSEVAVKLLHRAHAGDAGAAARLRAEAATMARLDHPNVCRVLGVGEAAGSPFVVMERLEGESLADRMGRGVLAPREAVQIVAGALEGLAAAHALEVMHRDFKPENVFLARSADGCEVPKVLDFGVAKLLGDDAERVKMTRTGALVGTPAYMSPEQALGLESVDTRSDLWSAGVVLFEALAGRLPFQAPNYNAMLVRIATESPPSLAEVAPGIDPSLVSLVDHALAREPSERFASAGEFAGQLRGWLDGARTARPTPRRVPLPTPFVSNTPMSWAETNELGARAPTRSLGGLEARRTRRGAWLAALAAVGGLATAGFFLRADARRRAPALATRAIPRTNASALSVAPAQTTPARAVAMAAPVVAPPPPRVAAPSVAASPDVVTPSVALARRRGARRSSARARGADGGVVLESGIARHPDF